MPSFFDYDYRDPKEEWDFWEGWKVFLIAGALLFGALVLFEKTVLTYAVLTNGFGS